MPTYTVVGVESPIEDEPVVREVADDTEPYALYASVTDFVEEDNRLPELGVELSLELCQEVYQSVNQ